MNLDAWMSGYENELGGSMKLDDQVHCIHMF